MLDEMVSWTRVRSETVRRDNGEAEALSLPNAAPCQHDEA